MANPMDRIGLDAMGDLAAEIPGRTPGGAVRTNRHHHHHQQHPQQQFRHSDPNVAISHEFVPRQPPHALSLDRNKPHIRTGRHKRLGSGMILEF
jgi:hypothetical protein